MRGKIFKAGGVRGMALARQNQRSAGNMNGVSVTGESFDGWFPPGTPMAAQAPKTVNGRAWDFPVGTNLDYTPRAQQGQDNITFALLRRFADPAQGGLDLCRLAIETVKQEMKRQKFKIVSRDDPDSDGGQRARDIEKLLQKPDGRLRWRGWLNQLLEDHLVIDAPTIYYRMGQAGGVRRPLFEQIDGATITLLLDSSGRTPEPPLPAFQQVLHGLPAVNYTTEEIGYYVDNPRPGRIYGMSPVEQICTIITIALNRQLSVLNYFTAGSIPDMLVGVPSTWNAKQISEFQDWWESVLQGQLDKRRGVRFIPGETKPFETKDQILKNDFDEWLARVVCYGFNLSPESLVKQTNRATAETGKEAALEQGLEPRKQFVKDVIDDGLDRIGASDLELQWKDEEIVDAKTRADVIAILRPGKSTMTLAEARKMAHLPPATPEDLDELEPPVPEVDGGFDEEEGVDPPTGQRPDQKDEAAKAARGSLPRQTAIAIDEAFRARVEAGLTRIARRVLRGQRRALLAYVRRRPDVQKAHDLPTEADLREWLQAIQDQPWDEQVRDELRRFLARLSRERSAAALDTVGDLVRGDDDEYRRLLQQANERAVHWAQTRAGNLITEVSDTTRQAVNELAADAIDQGLTNDDLAARIRESFAFSDSRAEMIATTETANAETAGTLIGFAESGVVEGKEWSADQNACDICLAMDGEVVGLNEKFSDGSNGPPAHPRCRCVVAAVVRTT